MAALKGINLDDNMQSVNTEVEDDLTLAAPFGLAFNPLVEEGGAEEN